MVTKVRNRARGRPAYKDVLTPAEWRVAHSAQHGLTNKEIAERLQISVDGVKYHIANVLSKLGLKNKIALQQWFQVPLGSAMEDRMNQPENSKQKPVALTHLGQVSRTVSNLEKSVEFFRDILNVPHLYSFGNLAFFDLEGTRLFLNESEDWNTDESILYFSVIDIKTICNDLSENGVKCTHQPHKIHTHEDGTEEWMAFIEDPDGRPLGLMSSLTPKC